MNDAIRRIHELLEITLNQLDSKLKTRIVADIKKNAPIQPTASPLVQKMQGAAQRKALRAAKG